jgi:hypothetical protein
MRRRKPERPKPFGATIFDNRLNDEGAPVRHRAQITTKPKTIQQKQKGNKTMKEKRQKKRLSKDQISAALADLAEVQQEIRSKSRIKEQLVRLLNDEFTRHEEKYRNGVETSKGFLKRIPRSWDIVTLPVVEVA